MSDPRSDAEKLTDPVVAEAYRDLATERVPDALDALVLKKARSAAPQGFARSTRWLRPMAWAATVALSLAIVVQLAEVPEAPPSASETLRADKARQEPSSAPVAVTAAAPDKQAVAERDTAIDSAAGTPVQRTRKELRADSVATSADAQAFRVLEAPILDDAAEIARLQKGPGERNNLAAARGVPATSGLNRAARSRVGCDAEAVSRAASWHACIVELEKAGLTELATREREQLALEFPDFEWPAESR